ncbi:MAG: short-chain fatty acid transporter [Phycisphaerales bacterium JB039]
MISRLGLALSEFFRKTAPDPFALAVILTIVAGALAFSLGDFPNQPEGIGAGAYLLDAWRAGDGLWRFLAFSMQMCLILVTGHALAASRPMKRLIDSLSSLPRSGAAGAAMVGLVAAVLGLVNWGLGLIAGALLAREVGRALHRRGVRAHYPLLVAAGYMGMLVWHGGLSGSAPLSVTTPDGASKVLPDEAMLALGDAGISLDQTLLSPLNIVVCAGLLLLVPLALWLLAPRAGDPVREIAEFDCAGDERAAPPPPVTVPELLDRTPPLAWLLAIGLLAAFARYGQVDGFTSVGLNEVNVAMLALGLLFHGSLASYAGAVEEGARGCAGIIIQFPLYAGIMAMLSASGLIQRFAEALAAGGQTGVPLLTFLSAAVVNIFVPSGGGQWGIQGPIALEAGHVVGVAPGKMVMAVAYGDQLTNMLQPFWALPLLAITGAKARDIVGYTAVVMLAAGAWMALCLLLL